MSATSSTRPGWIILIRDVISYAGGWALIAHQALFVPPSQVNEWFLLLGGSLIGVPGLGEILALRARQQANIGTAGPHSSPPEPASSPVQP